MPNGYARELSRAVCERRVRVHVRRAGATFAVTVDSTGVAPINLATDARLANDVTIPVSDAFGYPLTQSLPSSTWTLPSDIVGPESHPVRRPEKGHESWVHTCRCPEKSPWEGNPVIPFPPFDASGRRTLTGLATGVRDLSFLPMWRGLAQRGRTRLRRRNP
jgi:hypothetical protein